MEYFQPVLFVAFIYLNTTRRISARAEHLGSTLSTSVSYTAGYKFNNLGIRFKLKFLSGTDLYFVIDNIIQAFNYKKAYRLNAAFGINLSNRVKNEKIEISEIQNEIITF